MNEIFKLRQERSYDLRHQNTFKISLVNAVCNGTRTVSLLRPKLWEQIPIKIIELDRLDSF